MFYRLDPELTDEEPSLPVEGASVERDLEVDPSLGLGPRHDASGSSRKKNGVIEIFKSIETSQDQDF